jgi:UDP-N-acetylmuramate dehydrogenase
MIEVGFSLKSLNTFGVAVNAAAFARFSSIHELIAVLKQNNHNLPLYILGGGSNILFTKDCPSLVLKNEMLGKAIVAESDELLTIKVGAGEKWHDFVLYAVSKGWGGIENLSLIPGSVGASPMQNIGAYGVEIKDVFESLEAFHIESGEIHTFSKEDCRFGYRESVFKRELKNEYIITSVSFNLMKKPLFNTAYGAIQQEIERAGVTELSVKAISDAVIRIRQSKLPDPAVLGNAGSFFKNPVVAQEIADNVLKNWPDAPNYPQQDGSVKLAAGWLIEKAGLKGYRTATCGVHEKQALVLVNYGGATGQEVVDLSQFVMDSVVEKFGVQLEREVNIL